MRKLQIFLNTYEGAKLKVTVKYTKVDYLAVKRWQQKYKANILAPMRLKGPTGTIYTSSMRQIERQTTSRCGRISVQSLNQPCENRAAAVELRLWSW